MGAVVFSARPPFAVQLISDRPLIGPAFYDEHWSRERKRVVFPAGLIATAEAYVVSYGKDDNSDPDRALRSSAHPRVIAAASSSHLEASQPEC